MSDDLIKELRRIKRQNLKLKMHMQVLVNHPIGLASSIISKKYNSQTMTKQLQISTQN